MASQPGFPQPWRFRCALTHVLVAGIQVAKGMVTLVIKCDTGHSPAFASQQYDEEPEHTLHVYKEDEPNPKLSLCLDDFLPSPGSLIQRKPVRYSLQKRRLAITGRNLAELRPVHDLWFDKSHDLLDAVERLVKIGITCVNEDQDPAPGQPTPTASQSVSSNIPSSRPSSPRLFLSADAMRTGAVRSPFPPRADGKSQAFALVQKRKQPNSTPPTQETTSEATSKRSRNNQPADRPTGEFRSALRRTPSTQTTRNGSSQVELSPYPALQRRTQESRSMLPPGQDRSFGPQRSSLPTSQDPSSQERPSHAVSRQYQESPSGQSELEFPATPAPSFGCPEVPDGPSTRKHDVESPQEYSQASHDIMASLPPTRVLNFGRQGAVSIPNRAQADNSQANVQPCQAITTSTSATIPEQNPGLSGLGTGEGSHQPLAGEGRRMHPDGEPKISSGQLSRPRIRIKLVNHPEPDRDLRVETPQEPYKGLQMSPLTTDDTSADIVRCSQFPPGEPQAEDKDSQYAQITRPPQQSLRPTPTPQIPSVAISVADSREHSSDNSNTYEQFWNRNFKEDKLREEWDITLADAPDDEGILLRIAMNYMEEVNMLYPRADMDATRALRTLLLRGSAVVIATTRAP
ncbi:hypothetical protein GE09DRAFT_233074 [Coniochaeta sp. 2T2.1]|nr:hypothetical protein GE09DRAFT_233074 [Coniochaeta sp. 2T2.1]